MKNTIPKIKLISASVIFGTIGVVRKTLPMTSGMLSVARGFIGVVTLLIILITKKQKLDFKSIKSNLPVLIFSGVSIGINWILIFEAMNHTSVAVASLCYYTSPIFMIFGSAILFREKITLKNIICIFFVLLGMTLVSGIFSNSLSVDQSFGIMLSIVAAILYATGMVLNKKLHDISAIDRTIAQLFFAAVVVIPYSLFVETQPEFTASFKNIFLLLVIGVLHTGIAFVFTFDGVANLDTKTVAFFTYIDPVVSVLSSALILKEPITFSIIIGAVLIIGSALYNELKSN